MKRLAHVQEAGTWVERPHWSLLYGMVNKFMNGPLVLLSFVIIMLVFIALKKIELPNIKKIKWDNPIVIVAVMTIGIYLFAFIISLLTNSSIFIDRYMYFLSLGWFTLLGYVSIFIFDKNLKIIILPLLIFIIGFNPFRTHNRESDQLVAYAKSFNGSYIITPPHYDLTFLFHGEKELFQDLKEGVALFQHEIYPIHGLHEVDMQHVKRPIILIDAGSEFLYGERKLLEDLKQQFSLIENRAFKGGYEVFVFN